MRRWRLGAIEGKDFGDAMFRNWLGAKPADGGLKTEMLAGKVVWARSVVALHVGPVDSCCLFDSLAHHFGNELGRFIHSFGGRFRSAPRCEARAGLFPNPLSGSASSSSRSARFPTEIVPDRFRFRASARFQGRRSQRFFGAQSGFFQQPDLARSSVRERKRETPASFRNRFHHTGTPARCNLTTVLAVADKRGPSAEIIMFCPRFVAETIPEQVAIAAFTNGMFSPIMSTR